MFKKFAKVSSLRNVADIKAFDCGYRENRSQSVQTSGLMDLSS